MMRHDEAARLASAVLELRRRRAEHLPAELFGEPAWGILLSLFLADATGERVTIAEACRRSGGSEAVSRRWLEVLRSHGLVAGDLTDGDEMVVALSPRGVHAVEACMKDAQLLFGEQVGR